MESLILIVISFFAGLLGSMLGLGGGIIIVPTLTLLFNVDIKYAVATSLVAIIATSSGAAVSFLKDHLINIRVAIFLELGTVAGAVTGFFLSTYLQGNLLFLIFGFFLLLSALLMLFKKDAKTLVTNHSWSNKLNLHSHYLDHQQVIHYHVAHVPFGMISMYFAGILSALLGIGSGSLKVLAMNHAMKLPLKVSSATSNFMIGVTASASAGAYFFQGYIKPDITTPVVLGVLLGSYVGPKMMMKMQTQHLRKLFVVVILFISYQMIKKGL